MVTSGFDATMGRSAGEWLRERAAPPSWVDGDGEGVGAWPAAHPLPTSQPVRVLRSGRRVPGEPMQAAPSASWSSLPPELQAECASYLDAAGANALRQSHRAGFDAAFVACGHLYAHRLVNAYVATEGYVRPAVARWAAGRLEHLQLVEGFAWPVGLTPDPRCLGPGRPAAAARAPAPASLLRIGERGRQVLPWARRATEVSLSHPALFACSREAAEPAWRVALAASVRRVTVEMNPPGDALDVVDTHPSLRLDAARWLEGLAGKEPLAIAFRPPTSGFAGRAAGLALPLLGCAISSLSLTWSHVADAAFVAALGHSPLSGLTHLKLAGEERFPKASPFARRAPGLLALAELAWPALKTVQLSEQVGAAAFVAWLQRFCAQPRPTLERIYLTSRLAGLDDAPSFWRQWCASPAMASVQSLALEDLDAAAWLGLVDGLAAHKRGVPWQSLELLPRGERNSYAERRCALRLSPQLEELAALFATPACRALSRLRLGLFRPSSEQVATLLRPLAPSVQTLELVISLLDGAAPAAEADVEGLLAFATAVASLPYAALKRLSLGVDMARLTAAERTEHARRSKEIFRRAPSVGGRGLASISSQAGGRALFVSEL